MIVYCFSLIHCTSLVPHFSLLHGLFFAPTHPAAALACENVALRMEVAAAKGSEQSARLADRLVASLRADAGHALDAARLVQMQAAQLGGDANRFIGASLSQTVASLIARGDNDRSAESLAQGFLTAFAVPKEEATAWRLRACALGRRWDALDAVLGTLAPTVFSSTATRALYARVLRRAVQLCVAARCVVLI